jgi:hypothetical protein
MRRSLRLASGLVLFTYITAHLVNHALGLVSLKTAEAGLEFAVEVWGSWPGTVLLYGAFAIHFVLALWPVYERRCRKTSAAAQSGFSTCTSQGIATSERIRPSGQPGPRPTWPPCGLTQASFGVPERSRM